MAHTTTSTRFADVPSRALAGFFVMTFAITWGVIVGTYSSVYVAKNVVLALGVKRDWSKTDGNGGGGAGTQFANIDA